MPRPECLSVAGHFYEADVQGLGDVLSKSSGGCRRGLEPWDSCPGILSGRSCCGVGCRCSGWDADEWGFHELPCIPNCPSKRMQPSSSSLLLPGPRTLQTADTLFPSIRVVPRARAASCLLSSGLRVNTGGGGGVLPMPHFSLPVSTRLPSRCTFDSVPPCANPPMLPGEEMAPFIFQARVCLLIDFQWNWPGIIHLFHGETHSCSLAQTVVNLGRLQTWGFSSRHE